MEEGKNTQFKDIIRQTRLYLKSLHRKRPFRRWMLFAGIIFIVYMTISICGCPRVRTFALRFTDRPEDRISTKTFSPDRGQIFDCAGNVIATNKEVYDIHLDCCVIDDPRLWEEKSRKLAQEIALVLPERTAPQWWDYFQNARRNKKRYLPIAKNVESDILDTLKKLTLLDEPTYKGGRIVTSKQMRDYPYGNLARRTIGAGRYVWDEFRFGIENAYNGDLDGEEGIRRTKHGYRRGKWCQSVLEYKPEVDGWNIYTTLNMEYQAVADSALRSAVETDDDIAGGCLALMEVGTGEIKALANIHRLDNGNIGEYLNYSIGYSYEPGEIAQTMTLAAALSDRLISGLDEKVATNHGKLSDTTAFVDDYIRVYERKMQTDSISILEGFTSSSRYVGAKVAERYSESHEYYYDWFRAFCIGSSQFDTKGMRHLDLPNSIACDINTIRAMGSGYEFTVTPMHMLTFYNAIAADGRLMKPMLVGRMTSEKYDAKQMEPTVLEEHILRKDVVDSVKSALRSCILNGTGQKLKDMPQEIAGKTGTARQIIDPNIRGGSLDPYSDSDGRRAYASSFAGFYPVDAPEYSVICVLFTKPTHKPLYGGQLPTKVVKGLIEGIEDLR